MIRRDFDIAAVQQLDAVHRMAFHLSRRADLAADLVQHTYLRAFRAAGNFELRESGLRPWLFRILHNAFYTSIQRSRRERNAREELSHQPVREEPAGGGDLASLDWEHVDERAKQAIDTLDARYRQVLLLWAVEGLTYREIAHALDIPIGTVMSRLYRARAILSRQLAALFPVTHMGSQTR